MTRMSVSQTVTFIFLFSLTLSASSQSPDNKDYIRAVQEADQYFYFSQDYEASSRLYAELLKKYPENCNLQAKLGISYLNVDGKKAEALKLLKKASLNVVKNDRDYTEYGPLAPVDTWFYLAHAYHENDSLLKAIDTYTVAKNKISSEGAFRAEYADNQIKACYFAMEAEQKKISVKNTLFVPWLSEYPGASHPALSANDSVFVFTVRKDDGNQIFCTYRNKDWEKPVDITRMLSGFDRLWSNSLTRDGSLLVLYMDDGADGNLYYSRRSGKEWSRVRKFGKTINTKYWEAHGSVTPDGKRLYFSSNREGGLGELDIWMSDLMTDGSWGKAVNAGNKINTPLNENTPFFDPATSSLIFASEGHPGMGGYDLFISTLSNGTWSEPIGLPSPLNSTSDNSSLFLSDIRSCYLSGIVDEKTGIRNIYNILTPGKSPDRITAEGNLDLSDGMNIDPSLAQISIKSSDSSSWRKLPVKANGKFQFVAPAGSYRLHVSYTGYTPDTINLSIPSGFSGSSLSVNSSLVPEKVSNGDFLVMRNILFDYNSDSLNSQARTDLERIADLIARHPGLKIEITGFTDSRGDGEYNLKLSGLRADAVISYLKNKPALNFDAVRKAAGVN
jgi:Tol biopolymer transport system component